MKNAKGKAKSRYRNIQVEKRDRYTVWEFGENSMMLCSGIMEDAVGWSQILEESGLNSVGE